MIRRRRPIQRSSKPIARSPIRRKAPRVRTHNALKPTYHTERQKRNARYKVERPKVRAFCYRRDDGRCRCPCQRPLKLETDNPFLLYNANEILPRSRGGDPLDPRNILGMATECHEQFTRNRLAIDVGPEGANGTVYLTGTLADGRVVQRWPSRAPCVVEEG